MDIQFFSPKIVRILKYPQNSVIDKKSLSVVKTPEKMDLNISEDENYFTINSSFDGMLKNRFFNIIFMNAQNEPISKTIDYKGEMLELQL